MLLWVSHKFKDQLKNGDVTLGYLVGYSVIRYFMDTMRTDGTSAQTLSIVLAVAGCVVLVVRHLAFKKAEKPAQEVDPE